MHDSKPIRYIAIEGPIGVGKTSLAKRLADHFGYRFVKEEAGKNPFLERFYEDQGSYAFQTQVFFLLSRYQQLKRLAQGELFEKGIVTDYILDKDRIFAQLNLEDDELTLYESVYKAFLPTVPQPDLIVYLQARPEILHSRVRKRGIGYERNISIDYLKRLANGYNDYFFHYGEKNDTPLLVVNTSEIDFVESERDLDHLIREIQSVQRGTRHYIPLGSR